VLAVLVVVGLVVKLWLALLALALGAADNLVGPRDRGGAPQAERPAEQDPAGKTRRRP
jgi:hypothetical protein